MKWNENREKIKKPKKILTDEVLENFIMRLYYRGFSAEFIRMRLDQLEHRRYSDLGLRVR